MWPLRRTYRPTISGLQVERAKDERAARIRATPPRPLTDNRCGTRPEPLTFRRRGISSPSGNRPKGAACRSTSTSIAATRSPTGRAPRPTGTTSAISWPRRPGRGRGDGRPGSTRSRETRCSSSPAGPATPGILAAERVGAEGRVIQTDFAEAMVDAARRRVEGLGLENVEHRVLDAETMDLDDDSVDGVLCRFGYMLMADPAKALAETRRVLGDGGRLAFAVWAGPTRTSGRRFPGMTLVARGKLPPPEPGNPGIFALGDPGPDPRARHRCRLRRAADRAGRDRVAVRQARTSTGRRRSSWPPRSPPPSPSSTRTSAEEVRVQVADAMNEQELSKGPATGLVHVVIAE